jgi:hypothetical protein
VLFFLEEVKILKDPEDRHLPKLYVAILLNHSCVVACIYLSIFFIQVLYFFGLLTYYGDLNPQPKCCGDEDDSFAVVGALPMIALMFTLIAYIIGFFVTLQDYSNPLTKLKYYKNIVAIITTGFSSATVLCAAIDYGTQLQAALLLLFGKSLGFLWSCWEYSSALKRSSNITLGSIPMGPNDMSMGSSKCAYCCSSCCCLYMLITLTISLLFMATSNGSGNPEYVLNNYQEYWASGNCESLSYTKYMAADNIGFIDYYNVTDVVTGNYGTVSNTVTTLLGSAAHRMLAKTEILVLTRLFY